ncbi:MAG TPA: hypothetical protein VFW48_01710 [Solirubrobacterales bacterium]|nr:hypothetical protein [Solirubrobacterales bacterium]
MSEGVPGGEDLGFYQVAASVFVVLLLTGVAGEIRDLRGRKTGDGEPDLEISRAYSLGVALVLSALLLGELLALLVLLEPPPSDFQRMAVGICLAVSVLGVPALVVLAMWEERLRRLRRSLVAVFAGIAAILAVVGIYLASVALTDPPPNTYHVYGTCASGRCGLNERSTPSTKARRLRQLHDGDEITIVCQTIGAEVPAPRGGSSIVWNRLRSGGYVTDLYVDTPPLGSDIPLCGNRAEGGRPRG